MHSSRVSCCTVNPCQASGARSAAKVAAGMQRAHHAVALTCLFSMSLPCPNNLTLSTWLAASGSRREEEEGGGAGAGLAPTAPRTCFTARPLSTNPPAPHPVQEQ